MSASGNANGKRKKIILKIIAVLALFIPTYLAVFFYLSAKDDPVDEGSVYAVDFLDTRGRATHYEKDDPTGQALISLFMEIHESAMNTDSLPSDLEKAPFIAMTYYSYDLETSYRYYFSPSKPSSSYYTDQNGNAYRIPATQAIEFLDSDFSACLYESSIAPVLRVLGQDYPADSMEWSYYSYSGDQPHTVVTQGDAGGRLSASYRDVSLEFDRLPDESAVTVSNSAGGLIFEGSYPEFLESSAIVHTVKGDTTLIFAVEASWEDESSRRDGFGHASYSFRVDVVYDPNPLFWLGEDSVEVGEFAVLSGIHVDDPDALEVTFSPDVGCQPIFFTDGEYVRALLAFPFDPDAGRTLCTVTVRYQSTVQQLQLTLNPCSATLKTRKYNYSNQVKLTARSEKNVRAFTDLLTTLPYGEQIFFTGPFGKPDENQNRARFGDTVDNGKQDERFLSPGIAWVCYKEEPVLAAGAGKVIYAGKTDLYGETVIVDHGLGLRSVYGCLGSLSVEVGDFVAGGDTVGTGGGKSGYTDGHTCYQEFWVGGTPVSHYPLVAGGRTEGIVFGESPE